MGYGLCECGCGGHAPLATTTYRRIGHVKGQPVRFIRGHNNRKQVVTTYRRKGDRYEHVVIAEQALGRPLPRGAEVHHVDDTLTNNERSNLVICENRAYHKLLHARARVIRRGGDPRVEKICGRCDRVLPLGLFYIARRNQPFGKTSYCKSCAVARLQERAA